MSNTELESATSIAAPPDGLTGMEVGAPTKGTRQRSFRRHEFANGLKLISKEVHAAPVVSFWVWYKVGARDEHIGITGISHWVEHMMFKGTSNRGKGRIMQVVAENGGTLNAFTSDDWTAYFETLPSDRLDLGISIESDRMVNSLFDPAEVASERTVIISEREGHENEPDYMLNEEVSATAFKVHAYGNGIIGWKSDLQTMTREDLYNHYKTYYAPNNATVVVVGDFDTDELIAKLETAFGSYEPSQNIPQVRGVEPEQKGERRVVVRHPGATPQLEIVYHTPAASDPDIYPLMVADALLSGAKPLGFGGAGMGRSARLYKSLVATEIAVSAGSYFALHKDPNLFVFGASSRQTDDPEGSLRGIEHALLEEVRKLQDGEITTEELAKAVRQSRAQFIYSGDSVSSQAYMFGFLESINTADMYDEALDRLAAVTPEDVQRVARKYLTADNRTVGWFIPIKEEGDEEGDASAASPDGMVEGVES
ncbi:MAG: insulinase family protein [Chloroflexota bacterium]|nr:insulinase family protein [Chloroflexota bacterium]